MYTVLVTCVGSGVGQSIIDSLNITRKYRLIGCDTNPNVYARNFCDLFLTVPSIYSDNYLTNLLKICIENKVDIVIPGHDHELALLSENRRLFNKEGIKILVSNPDLIKISRDKYIWYNFFNEFDCPVVTTYKVIDFKQKPDKSIFPAIVKPTGGSASQGIMIVNEMAELNEADNANIIQPYLFPKSNDSNYPTLKKYVDNGNFIQMSEISIQLIFSSQSEFKGIFISKNSLKNGVPTFIEPINPDDFEFLKDIMKFVPILSERKVKGPVNIQGRITNKGLVCFEMNMRFTGITGNRAQLGFNEVAYLVDDFLGNPSKLNGYAKNKLGVRQVACTTIPRNINFKKTKKTFSILGASGSIGSQFVNKLIESNNADSIYLICRDTSYDKYKKMFTLDKIKIVKDSDEMVANAFSKSDILVNFASALATKPVLDHYESILFQFKQTQKIIKSNIPFIINISSQSVYDQKLDCEKSEKELLKLSSLYSFQKQLTESFFQSIESYSPLSNVISVRLSRVLSINEKGQSFFEKIIENLYHNRIVEISNPKNKTNLIDSRDVVNALLFLVENKTEAKFPNVINVGGTNISMQNYCEKVIACLGKTNQKLNINYSPSEEITTSSMINTNLMTNLGWYPSFTIEDTINTIISKVKLKGNNR